MSYGPSSLLGDVLRNKRAEAVVRKHLTGIVNAPLEIQLRYAPLEQVTGFLETMRADPAARAAFYAELATVDETAAEPPRPAEARTTPSPDYEPTDVPVGGARPVHPPTAIRWSTFELELHGPAHGNPFTDVALRAEFRHGDRTLTAQGFYDGDGVHRIRFLPDEEGTWSFRTTSNARSLDAVAGDFTCGPPAPGDHGPVRVHGTYHFRHADGTRHLPVGTTAYAWTHQGEELEERTLRTLAAGPFNKVRMCVFPKAYLFNADEPPLYPFAGSPQEGWDFRRPVPAYFRHLERRIAQLGALGVEADLILFHPYDRWGFSDMGPVADERYLRYVVSRLAAYPNVWWSLANEYDLMWAKDTDHWHRSAATVKECDPHGHLLGVHNCQEFWDNSIDWVTHSSVQRVDVYRTAENTDAWRTRWGKPVVVDECGYEGDIDQGWGNLTPQEMVRRCWEGAVRGGYVAHGETYLADDDVLWWSKGGELKGESPARIAFLRDILEETPGDGIDPLPSDWDVPVGGVEGRYYLTYFGFMQPRRRTFALAPGVRYEAEVIDTWNMTVTPLPGTYEGVFTLPLPARPYIAVRLVARDSDSAG
ncbi:DUF5605 domain-containing protein [Streptomyces sp. MBT65]|uniref:DUF5605 domain-containing protein n=1 Tax=Streptomyces sp. MBT65 TaxID=1488395 RepID=UPI001909A906|nr:DUF5605 domain-containing protein [Streptomyces sp. MBT65]MBK3574726.1 DUF5605 domain-containing protein [Streptomyces sp. MBT65]